LLLTLETRPSEHVNVFNVQLQGEVK